MARILFAWELGGGAGHVAPFYPIAQSLIAAGHELTLAVREPERVISLFKGPSRKVYRHPWQWFHNASRNLATTAIGQQRKSFNRRSRHPRFSRR